MKADTIVENGEIPADWSEKAEEVSERCKAAYAQLDERGDNEDDPLVVKYRNHGLHAYAYLDAGDGSIVALYANSKSGKVRMKAFPSIKEASAWSPRSER